MAAAPTSRRSFLRSSLAAAGSAFSLPALARDWSGQTPVRYPDPDIVAIEDAFKKYKLGNTPIQRLHTGALWAEGPAWNAVGRYLVWSDIPNNIQLRRTDEDGHVGVFRHPSGNSNGNTFDFQGRQLSCEHGNRRVVRYEHNGKVSVIADTFEGKPLNAPNDIVVHPNGSIWFTDPGYGSMMNYEGNKGTLELKEAVYRVDPGDGKITKMTDMLAKPNGLCFSPDYKKLYIADTGEPKNILVFEVEGEKTLKAGREWVKMNHELPPELQKLNERRIEIAKERESLNAQMQSRRRVLLPPTGTPPPKLSEEDKSKLESVKAKNAALDEARQKLFDEGVQIEKQIDAWNKKHADFISAKTQGQGGSDGIRCDVDGNLWSAAGWVGDGYDGVHCFSPEGQLIGQIKLPEICSNLCFGGEKRNRLFMTASTSLYAVYVETQGAHFC